jgi:hypothetical protein
MGLGHMLRSIGSLPLFCFGFAGHTDILALSRDTFEGRPRVNGTAMLCFRMPTPIDVANSYLNRAELCYKKKIFGRFP